MSTQPEATDNLASPSHSMLHRFHHDVMAYGAIGDGATDDTAAIQAAITTCHAAGGGTVFFPAGSYKISTLTIGSSGAGQTAAIKLAGASWGVDTVHKGTILEATGAADYGPMLSIHNAHSITVENMMFYADNLATTCVRIEHDPADISPASFNSEHMRFSSCTFRGGRVYNVQINSTSDTTITGNVSLVKFDSCMFNHFSGTAHTTAHVYQVSGNALSNSFDNCQFYGDGTYPTYGVRMESGAAHFYGCQSVTLGTVDIYMTAISGQVPPNINIYGWESQSKRFLSYDNSATTSNSIRASVISGVSHSDIEGTGTYSITWIQNVATGAYGNLILEGVVADYNIILTGTTLRPVLLGVSLVTAANTVQGTAVPYATGFWRNANSEEFIGLGSSARITHIEDTDGVHYAQLMELDDATGSSNKRSIGTLYSQNRTSRHMLSSIVGYRKNSNADWYGGLEFRTQMTDASSSSPTSLTLAATLDHTGRFTPVGGVDTRVVATASLPAAATAMNGHILIEDAGAGDRNLIIYAGGQRFRIDGGANV